MTDIPKLYDPALFFPPVSTHKGWAIAKDRASGLMFIFRPDGSRYGYTQTEAGARIMRRRVLEGN